MMRTITICLLMASLLACGGQPPPTAPAMRATEKLTDWSRRDTSAPLWPASARSVQIIITDAWAEGDRLIWVVTDGSKLYAVYNARAGDVADLKARVDTTRPTAQSPLIKLSEGGQGIVIGPPPPPGGPVGDPLVKQVIGYASHLAAGSP